MKLVWKINQFIDWNHIYLFNVDKDSHTFNVTMIETADNSRQFSTTEWFCTLIYNNRKQCLPNFVFMSWKYFRAKDVFVLNGKWSIWNLWNLDEKLLNQITQSLECSFIFPNKWSNCSFEFIHRPFFGADTALDDEYKCVARWRAFVLQEKRSYSHLMYLWHKLDFPAL